MNYVMKVKVWVGLAPTSVLLSELDPGKRKQDMGYTI